MIALALAVAVLPWIAWDDDQQRVTPIHDRVAFRYRFRCRAANSVYTEMARRLAPLTDPFVSEQIRVEASLKGGS